MAFSGKQPYILLNILLNLNVLASEATASFNVMTAASTDAYQAHLPISSLLFIWSINKQFFQNIFVSVVCKVPFNEIKWVLQTARCKAKPSIGS